MNTFKNTNLFLDQHIGVMGRVFAYGHGDKSSIAGRVISKTQKVLLFTTLFNTQHYEVRIEGEVELTREMRSTLPYILVL